MKHPLFYQENASVLDKTLVLEEAVSKHLIQVLRMQPGDEIRLTNGKGIMFQAQIADVHRKSAVVAIMAYEAHEMPQPQVSIAISPVKNNSRFEWFLEKATEIGVSRIIPLICDRTEKQQLKMERLNNILISAMLQSQQCWLPELEQPVAFSTVINQLPIGQNFIAHCEESVKQSLVEVKFESNNRFILIGPEGDFSKAEIYAALEAGCIPAALGKTRLRTETAGIVAATVLCNR